MKAFGEYIRRAFGDLIAYILGTPREGANAGTYLTAVLLFLLAVAVLLFLAYLFFSHRKMPFEKMEAEAEEGAGTTPENPGEPTHGTLPETKNTVKGEIPPAKPEKNRTDTEKNGIEATEQQTDTGRADPLP